ncbi:MAG TPA: M4 family metallopeptidase [Lysobacter sp.]
MQFKSSLLGTAILATLAVSAPAFAGKTDSVAALRAKGLIDGKATVAVLRADADRFAVKNTVIDRDGTEHVRFDRTYRGLPVIGGDVVVHSRNGQFKSASLTLKTTGRPGITPQLSADQAIVEAGTAFGTGFNGVPSAKLVVYARGAKPVLAYEVVMSGTKKDQTPTDMHYFVDARNGKVLDGWDTIHTAASNGTGKTISLGDVTITTNSIAGGYETVDPSRGGGSTWDAMNLGDRQASRRGKLFTDADNVWGDYTNVDRASAAAEAHYGVAMTWDFYKNTFGRNGIFNDGRGVKSYVHVNNNYVNAFWTGSAMFYGDGDGVTYRPLTVIDVAGHEMSHGVNQAAAGLVYSGDAGGLNEANSDIMGAMVEFYANNASDPGDYLIGEEIYISNVAGSSNQKALRYMYNPGKDGASRNCWSTSVASLDPHYSSGVGNHFFYLLAEGSGAKSFGGMDHTSPTCNGSSITGIGRAAAAAIWYRALDVYFTSSTTYPQARTATLNAARDLYGAGSAQYNAVAAAWSAVSVN